MTLYLTAPAIVALIGVVAYGLADGKLGELGRLAFACGLFVALLQLR